MLPTTLLCGAVIAAQTTTEPSLVTINARVFTGVAASPWAEAFSIAGDRISAVGTTAAIQKLATASTRVIDAEGRLVIPGINDAHVHVGGVPEQVRLAGPPVLEHDPSLDEVLNRLKAAVPKALRRSNGR